MRLSFVGSTALALTALAVACDDATGPDPDQESEPKAAAELLFSAHELEGHGAGVFRIRADGSGLQKISDHAGGDLEVSPNGGRFAMVDARGVELGRDIIVVGMDGSEQRLTNDEYWDVQPTWSADGTRIAFLSNRSGDFQVHVMDADGSDIRRLLDTEGHAERPAWSTGGDRIAFSRTQSPSPGVYVVDFDELPTGSGTAAVQGRRIADGWASSLDWRADDAYLVGVGPQDANGNRGVVRIAADGSEVLSLTPASVGGHGAARWSPEGERIAYLYEDADSDTPGGYGLYLMDADGTNVTEVPIEGENYLASVDWLP